MNKKAALIICLLFVTNGLSAVMKYSADTVISYKTNYLLAKKYPENKKYHFDLAITLAYMGKIEAATNEFKRVNELDEDYANKVIKVYSKKASDSWKTDFKLAFSHYFLFEDLNGKIELAERRIIRAQRENNKSKEKQQKEIVDQLTPSANYHKSMALEYFQKVSEKEPVDAVNAWGYTYMAVIKGMEGKWNRAENLCEKAIAIEPEAYAIRAAYMEALKQNGHPLQAAGQMASALKLKSAQENYEKELFGDEYLIN